MQSATADPTTLEEVQGIADLREAANGVQWYAQRLHPNVHYIVGSDGKVYTQIGYHGRVAFHLLAYGRAVYEL